jgi:HK97 gp10 family phage protein
MTAPRMRVKVEGLKEIQTALQSLPKATAKNVMRRVLRLRAKVFTDRASAMAPEDTGYLKDTIAVSTKTTKAAKRGRKKLSPHAVEIFAGPGGRRAPAPRGMLQEFGTKSMAPQPFMRPAWDGSQQEILDGIAADMWQEIEAAVGRMSRKAARQAAAAASEGGE